MKIAVVASSYIPSNAANSIQVMKVCQALIQAGSTVELWVPEALNQNLPDWSFLQTFYGIKTEFPIHWVRENLRLRRYDFTWKVLREVRQWDADVVYTWMAQVAYLALLNHVPTALELHMLPTGKLGPWLLRRVVETHGRKLFLPITTALREKLAQAHRIELPGESVQIAPMGSEPERYHSLPGAVECRARLNMPDLLTAAYTGHLYPGRGMELLVHLAKAFPRVQFLWIGGREPDVETWRDRIKTDGIENILLTGFIPNAELPLYQAAADILLMPYGRNVGISGAGDTADVCSPMKLFDYLSAGRAILSSDLPVIREVLSEDNARFAQPDDPASWEIVLGRMIADEPLRAKLSANAKLDAERYSWLRRAQATVDYFESDVGI